MELSFNELIFEDINFDSYKDINTNNNTNITNINTNNNELKKLKPYYIKDNILENITNKKHCTIITDYLTY